MTTTEPPHVLWAGTRAGPGGAAVSIPAQTALDEAHRPVRQDREGAVPALERVALERVEVQVDAQTRPGRQLEVAVLQPHRLVDQVAPRRAVVGVVLEDQEVRR